MVGIGMGDTLSISTRVVKEDISFLDLSLTGIINEPLFSRMEGA